MPGLKIINSVRAEHTRAKNKKPISHRGHKGHRGYRENRHRGVSASSFRDGAIRFCTGGSRGPFGYPAMNHKVGVPSQRTRLKSGSCFLLLGNATLQCGMSCVFFHFKNRRTCQLKSWRSQPTYQTEVRQLLFAPWERHTSVWHELCLFSFQKPENLPT